MSYRVSSSRPTPLVAVIVVALLAIASVPLAGSGAQAALDYL